jgi:hypothetical protein
MTLVRSQSQLVAVLFNYELLISRLGEGDENFY